MNGIFVSFTIGIGFVIFQFEFLPNEILVGSKGFGSWEKTIGAIVVGSVIDGDGIVDGYSNKVDIFRFDDKELDDSVDDSMDSGNVETATKLKQCMLKKIC